MNVIMTDQNGFDLIKKHASKQERQGCTRDRIRWLINCTNENNELVYLTEEYQEAPPAEES